MIMPRIFVRLRLRLTANMFGRKPDCLMAPSIRSRVLPRTDFGSLKYLETVGRERPTNSAKSSIVLIDLSNSHSPKPDVNCVGKARSCQGKKPGIPKGEGRAG